MLILEKPWTRQPPLWAPAEADLSIVAAWRVGVTVIDGKTQSIAGRYTDSAIESSPPVDGVQMIGRVVNTFHDVMIPDTNVDSLDGQSFTVFSWIKPTTGGTRYFVGRGRDGLGSGWSVRLGAENNLPLLTIVHTGGGTAAKSVASTIDISGNGAWITGVYNQGVGLSLYVNGVLSNATSFTNTTLRSSTRGWYLGGPTSNDSSLTSSSYGFVGDTVILSRAVRADEIAMHAGAPWKFFKPRRIYIPTATAAATAPTITALSARSITATSAQPRISYS